MKSIRETIPGVRRFRPSSRGDEAHFARNAVGADNDREPRHLGCYPSLKGPDYKHPWLSRLTRMACRRPIKEPSKLVAILIPLGDQEGFTEEEKISLAHLQHYLGSYDKFFLVPEGNVVEVNGIAVKHFPRRFFGSADNHGRLLWAPWFYRLFEEYRYILFYHLDSLVFSDQLQFWCKEQIDYIGSPWLVSEQLPWCKEAAVGNGGFALLNVQHALELFYRLYEQDPARYWMGVITRNPRWFRPFIAVFRMLRRLFPKSRLVSRPVEEWEAMVVDQCKHDRALDVFFGRYAIKYYPEWKVASVEDGLRFGFEVEPRRCFEMNGRKMPFGCHAWARYDRAFWEPHLLVAKRSDDRPALVL